MISLENSWLSWQFWWMGDGWGSFAFVLGTMLLSFSFTSLVLTRCHNLGVDNVFKFSKFSRHAPIQNSALHRPFRLFQGQNTYQMAVPVSYYGWINLDIQLTGICFVIPVSYLLYLVTLFTIR